MKTADHFQIGTILTARYLENVPNSYRRAYILGNIFPDLNFFTYLRGTFSQRKVRGHHFESAAKYLHDTMTWLQRIPKFRLYHYFRLGELTHYVADAFTYPHNRCFLGNLKAHVAYEEELHRTAEQEMKGYLTSARIVYLNRPSLWENFIRLHDAYLEQVGTHRNDLVYIASAVRLTMDVLICSKGKQIVPYWRLAS